MQYKIGLLVKSNSVTIHMKVLGQYFSCSYHLLFFLGLNKSNFESFFFLLLFFFFNLSLADCE